VFPPTAFRKGGALDRAGRKAVGKLGRPTREKNQKSKSRRAPVLAEAPRDGKNGGRTIASAVKTAKGTDRGVLRTTKKNTDLNLLQYLNHRTRETTG